MKLGIIRERKSPPDKRVVFSPDALLQLKAQYPQIEIKVESSDVRIFKDEAYIKAGFEVTENLDDCDVLLGVKEVPAEALIPGKKYFFFSHTIKKQPYNQKLLQAVIDKDITLYDHETLVDADGRRIVGFGRYAGIVGAYNAMRTFGYKYDLFTLPAAGTQPDREALINRLKKITLPPLKIVLTGKGKVGMGAKEILKAMKLKEVSPENFLSKQYTEPVFVQIDVLDYNKRIDGVVAEGNDDFFNNTSKYESDFEKFTQTADIFIAGHFYADGSPAILTKQMLKSPKNKIKLVADISCDIAGPVASTLRASTIAEPFYGYHPDTGEEVDVHHPAAIAVMAVDNLPCELPKDASEGFGEMFLENVIPAFFNGDKDGILKRGMITANGQLTERFKYLDGFVTERVL
ncbi:NAD(P)-dependent oxidoreductase [Flavobacterium rhizosphaerae]|uniref:Saccharopine dehydrogenase [NAD(+), L-lysine-forming] n=1 Tax=Flavobacterium rhizosphaerae TaxID=3163298 RepID=A0ABW8YYS0_9FLAO